MASQGDWKRKLYGRLHQDLTALSLDQVIESLGAQPADLTPTERGRVSSVVERVANDLEKKSTRQRKAEAGTG